LRRESTTGATSPVGEKESGSFPCKACHGKKKGLTTLKDNGREFERRGLKNGVYESGPLQGTWDTFPSIPKYKYYEKKECCTQPSGWKGEKRLKKMQGSCLGTKNLEARKRFASKRVFAT